MRLRLALFAFLIPALGLAGCAHAPMAMLTEAEQDQMAEAVLVYSQSHATFLGTNKVAHGYLMVRGADPSSILLENLQRDGLGFKPGSEFERDDNYAVSIGAFAPTSSNSAMGDLDAENREVGGAVERYTVTRANGRWIVNGYQLLEIVLVATPAAYVSHTPPAFAPKRCYGHLPYQRTSRAQGRRASVC